MPLPESRTITLPPGNEPQRVATNSHSDYYGSPQPDPFETDESDNLTEAQDLWLKVLLRIVELYPQSPLAEKDGPKLITSARIWADDFKFIPTAQIWDCYTETMRGAKTDFVPSAGSFNAAWERIQARTNRQTFQEQQEAETAQYGKALPEGKREIPLSSRIFRKLGRAIVCHCKYADGIAMAAQIEDSGNRPRWRCGRQHCNFDVDANNEAAVRKVSVEPHVMKTGSEPKPEESPLIETKKQNRAELFAETCNLDYETMTAEQREEIRKMAYWNDYKRAGTNARNFAEHWEIYLEWAGGEESKRLARERAQRYA